MTTANWTWFLLLIPAGTWIYLWHKDRQIHVWEAVGGIAVSALTIWLTLVLSNALVGADTETRSGYAWQAYHTPWWRAEWTEEESYTDSKGNTQYRTVTKSETHEPEWWLETHIGQIHISKATYEEITDKHGWNAKRGHRPDYDSGDRNDYYSNIKNADEIEYPVNALFRWHNPFTATDSLHVGREIADEEAKKLDLFEYPEAHSHHQSRRILGTDALDMRKWDQMCAVLGPDKHVNLILLDFGERSLETAVKQRDYWRNGKKNDLVLCVGDGWSYVFGWSKTELVKVQLQTLLLEHELNAGIVDQIHQVVDQEFEPYPWTQHKDLERPVPIWAVIVALFITAAGQWGFYLWATQNKFKSTR